MMNKFFNFGQSIKQLIQDNVLNSDNEFIAMIGNPSGVVVAPDNKIYVTNQSDGQVLTVLNRLVPNRYGRMVWIGRSKKSNIIEVLRLADDFSGMEDTFPLIPNHEHSYGDQNPSWVDSSQFLPLLVLPTGDELKIKIYPANITKTDGTGWVRFEGVEEYDLSSSQPTTTDEARYVLIEVDNDGNLSVIEGTEVVDRDTLAITDIPAATGFRSHAIVLSEDIGVLSRDSERNDFLDLRFDGRSKITALSDIDYINFNITATYAEVAGRMGWNPDEYTINIVTGLGPVLQVGQELYTIVFNDTGAQIDNGTAVYPVGASGGFPSVAEADSATHVTILGIILVSTMDIPDQEIGLTATILGKVRGIDTSVFNLGDTLWVAPSGTGLLNNITNVKPPFPGYVMQIGGVTVKDAVNGEIQLAIEGKPIDTTSNFWNGVFRESINFTVSSDGATITGSLVPDNGHDDMTMMFSDGFTLLDTSPAATIELTPGTDANPQANYIYVLKSAKVLAVSTSGWPIAEHIKVANVILRTAATTEIDGALGNRNWNDHIESTTTLQGHLSHITEKLRKFEAQWDSGIEGSIDIVSASSPDDVYAKNTAGKAYQLHLQNFPLIDMTQYDIDAVSQGSKTFTISGDGDLSSTFPDGRMIQVNDSTGNDGMYTVASTVWSDPDFIITVEEAIPDATADGTIGDDIHVVNSSVSAYLTTLNLNTEVLDSAGVSLSNKHFSFVVWGVQNRSGQASHLMLNLPGGSYNSEANAIADADGFTNYTIPSLFQGIGFLIARFTFNLSSAGSGTWTLNDTVDLRGFLPNTTAGGGGAGGGGVSTFLGLTDVPSAYTGQATKIPSVNAGETALEFVPLGATTELDNLATTAINADLVPDTNNTYEFGSALKQWLKGWFAILRTDDLELGHDTDTTLSRASAGRPAVEGVLFLLDGDVRELLTANRTYYVRTDGSDSNTGLVDSAGGAFLTIQKAIDVSAALDTSIYDITVDIGDGTYVEDLELKNILGSGDVTLTGNTGTPTNVVLDGGILKNTSGTHYFIDGLQFDKTLTSLIVAVQAQTGSFVSLTNVDFGSGYTYHILSQSYSVIVCTGTYTVSGGAAWHYLASGSAVIKASANVTLSGSPNFSNSFAYTTELGHISSFTRTFTGTVTGKRYTALLNSIINTFGGGANYFPGNVAGTTATGAQYA